MKITLQELLRTERFILLDGGMWRLLQQRGLGNDPPELWNLLHPERVEDVHRAYIEAGARIIYTNTLGGNRIRLAHAGLADKLPEINRAAVRAAKLAAGDRALVAGDLSSTGSLLEPYGDLSVEEAESIFREQAAILAGEGIDLFVVETMTDLREAEAAVRGLRAASDLPFICSLSFSAGGRTVMGDRPEEVMARLAALGAAAIGANCGTGAADMVPVIEAMAGTATVPVIAKPNAGLPRLEGERTVFPEGPEEMAAGLKRLAGAGARLVGGCCGSTPEHIRAINAVLAATPV